MRTRSCRAAIFLPFVLVLAGCGGSDADPEPAGASAGTDAADDVGASDVADADAADADDDGGADDASEADDTAAADDTGGLEQTADGVECPDGPRELDGVPVMTFHCGPGTVEVTTPSGTRTLSGGTCEVTDDTFAFNVGTVVLDVAATLDGSAPAVDYLGIAVHEGAAGDGTYDDLHMVTVAHTAAEGEDHTGDAGVVTLREGRTAGDATSGGVSAVFDCG